MNSESVLKFEEIKNLQRKAFTPVDENLWRHLVPWLVQRQEIAREILKCRDVEDRELMQKALIMNEDGILEILGMYKSQLM